MLIPTCEKSKTIQAILENPDLQARAGYPTFQTDVNRLLEIASNDSLPGITADVWLDKIIQSDVNFLNGYVERYQAGWLNPFYPN